MFFLALLTASAEASADAAAFCRRCCMRFSAQLPDHPLLFMDENADAGMIFLLSLLHVIAANISASATAVRAFYTTSVRAHSRRFLLLPLLCVLTTDGFCFCHRYACLQQTLSAPAIAAFCYNRGYKC